MPALWAGDIVAGVDRLLAEETTLLELARWTRRHGGDDFDRSPLARIATAVQNAYQFSELLQTRWQLLQARRTHACGVGDRRGEAELLRLGVLVVRVADLDGGRAAYAEALPIYREIHARLGEANCLQSLGDLAALRGTYLKASREPPTPKPCPSTAEELRGAGGRGQLPSESRRSAAPRGRSGGTRWRRYAEALPIYHEIRSRLGKANCLQRVWAICCARVVRSGSGTGPPTPKPCPSTAEHSRAGGRGQLPSESLGDLLALRGSDLEAARAAYAKALPIYREIRARLGEANCLQSLGDLAAPRGDDLEAATNLATTPKPCRIYREIHERLGEANCLQNLGDLAAACVDDLDGGAGRRTRKPCRCLPRDSQSGWERPTAFRVWAICCTAWSIWMAARDRLHRSLAHLPRDSRAAGRGQLPSESGRSAAPRGKRSGGHRTVYAEALPIYREIHARLGEANCLQSLGLLAMAEQRTRSIRGVSGGVGGVRGVA